MPLTPNQRAAVESVHEPLFIQAGAGTGKTFTLTKRLAHGLSEDSGHAIGGVDRLLTITFTNKAAGELIGRVRAELRACGLSQEALQVDAAWISTIHSMCRRMLLSHAFDVGIDPGANLLTEDETKGLAAIALDELLKEKAQDNRLVDLLNAFGVEECTKLISTLSELISLAPNGIDDLNFGPAPVGNSLQCVQKVLRVYEQAKRELDELGLPEGKKLYSENSARINQTIETLFSFAEDAERDVAWQYVSDVLGGCQAVRGGSFKEPYKAIFAECKGALVEAQTQASCANAYELLISAVELASDHVEIHGRLKRSKGALDTNDLLIAAYRMLERNPEIAREYQEHFDSVMVDEFQDTDSLQVGIIERLCDKELKTLTTVGDAQQSIYGFRGADLEVYRGMRSSMRAHGSCELELADNFRSHADILRFVEDIFSTQEFFGGEFLKVRSGRKEESIPAWANAEDARVKILFSAGHKAESGRGSTPSDALRRADARALADEFERLHGQGAAYGDMAILLQSTKATRAGAYLQELRARGIPCVVSGGSDFFLLNEVNVLVMFLRVLANRDDDEALFALLGSEMFDACDDDLLELSVINKQKLKIAPEQARLKPSLYDALRYRVASESYEPSATLVCALDVIDDALAQLKRAPLSQVVRDAVCASGWALSLEKCGVEGGAEYANIERFCDMLDDFESLNGKAVYRASEYYRDMLELAAQGTGARSKLGVLVSSGNEAVQIMTIHSSKGLEFPIVAVAEFEKSNQARGVQVLSLTENNEKCLAFGVTRSDTAGKYIAEAAPDVEDFAHAGDTVSFRAHACRLNSIRQEEEQQRLLYVALTRARDMLFLVAHDKSFGSTGEVGKGLTRDCLQAVFPDGVPTNNTIMRTRNGALVELAICDVPYDAHAEQEEQHDTQTHVIEHQYPSLYERQHISSYVQTESPIRSYSSIAQGRDAATAPPAQAITLHNREADAETVSPLGSAFHLVAQWLIETRSSDRNALEERIRSAVVRFGLTEAQAKRLLVAVGEWLGSDRFGQMMTSGRIYAEHAFCVDIDGYALEGFIDALCLDGTDKAIAVDYKTGTSAQGDYEVLRERYTLQAQCYAYALLSAGVCKEVELAFVRPEAHMEELVFEFKEDDLPQLKSAIL